MLILIPVHTPCTLKTSWQTVSAQEHDGVSSDGIVLDQLLKQPFLLCEMLTPSHTQESKTIALSDEVVALL